MLPLVPDRDQIVSGFAINQELALTRHWMFVRGLRTGARHLFINHKKESNVIFTIPA